MRKVRLTIEADLLRALKGQLSKTPKIFIVDSPQRVWLDAEGIKLEDSPDNSILFKWMKDNLLSFNVEIGGREEEIYNSMESFIRQKSEDTEPKSIAETEWRYNLGSWRAFGWLHLLFCYLVDFCELPSKYCENIEKVNSRREELAEVKKAI